jgi:hypothetical protein
LSLFTMLESEARLCYLPFCNCFFADSLKPILSQFYFVRAFDMAIS